MSLTSTLNLSRSVWFFSFACPVASFALLFGVINVRSEFMLIFLADFLFHLYEILRVSNDFYKKIDKSELLPIAFRAFPILKAGVRFRFIIEYIESHGFIFHFMRAETDGFSHFCFRVQRNFSKVMPAAIPVITIDNDIDRLATRCTLSSEAFCNFWQIFYFHVIFLHLIFSQMLPDCPQHHEPDYDRAAQLATFSMSLSL